MDKTANQDITLNYANSSIKFDKDDTYSIGANCECSPVGTWQWAGTSDIWLDLGGTRDRKTILRLTHKELWIEDENNTTGNMEEWHYESCKD